MNRKLLNGLLATAIIMGGAASVTSCKDTDEDQYAQLKSDNLSLGKKIEALTAAQKELAEAQAKCKQDCENAWMNFKKTGLEQWLNEYVAAKGKIATFAALIERVNEMSDEIEAARGEYDSLGARLDAILTTIKEYPELNGVAELLKNHNTDLPTVLSNAIADHVAMAGVLEQLEALFGEGKGPEDLLETINNAKTTADAAKKNADDALDLAKKLDDADFPKQISDLTERVKVNEENIAKLTKKLDALTGRLNKLVTGIIVQQVSNPVFGKINLPLDIKSGVLMAYFGDGDVTFPAVNRTASEYDGTNWITNADKANANIKPVKFSGVYGLNDGALNLGSVYMTVNPVNVDFENTTFELVNSKGETNGIKLGALANCDEELMFGFGRSAEVPTGLYKAGASYPATTMEDLNGIKFTVTDGFKDKVEAMLKQHSLSDIAALTKLIFDQFNNKFAARGVRAVWEYDAYDEEGNAFKQLDATYSEFSLAATAVKPLSYKFLYGTEFNPIGTISPIEDFTFGDEIKIEVPEFEFNLSNVPFNFSFGEIEVSLDGVEITVKVPATEVYDNDGIQIGYIKETTAIASDLSQLEGAISEAISSSLQSQDAALQAAFSEAMSKVASDINSQINVKMKEFETSINDQFNDIIGNMEDKVNGYLGTVNKYIDKVNGLINRVNKILKNPNHYLQIAMVYEGNDGQFHQVSNNSVLPSAFKLDGGNGLRLFATSYNGELLVPSYKKFVAVTNAYRTGDLSKTPVASVIADANNAEYWNAVVDGVTTRYALKLTKGYTYEIVYSSLDYHGYTSTRKFYVSAE
ncbi:MAG: hypothetical protein K2H88_09190 [Duncaniella sp.]|nr:hypothetical protein [Duncaniella sp.]